MRQEVIVPFNPPPPSSAMPCPCRPVLRVDWRVGVEGSAIRY